MSQKQDLEQLSALVDGALDERQRAQLLARLDEDDGLRARWGRYHLIGDALRGEPAVGAALDVAARVRDRLATEPVVLAPRRRALLPRPPAWVRPALGLAAAASLGAAVVVMMPRPQPPTGQPLASAAIPAPEVNKAEPAAQWTVVQQTPVTRWQARSPEAGRDLHRFLADHSEFAATGVKGAMPLATLVGYGAGR